MLHADSLNNNLRLFMDNSWIVNVLKQQQSSLVLSLSIPIKIRLVAIFALIITAIVYLSYTVLELLRPLHMSTICTRITNKDSMYTSLTYI